MFLKYVYKKFIVKNLSQDLVQKIRRLRMLKIKDIYPKFYKYKDFGKIYDLNQEKNIMVFSLSFIWIKYLTLLSSVFVLKNCNVTLVWSKDFFQDNQDQKENDIEVEKLRNSFNEKVENFLAVELDNIDGADIDISESEYQKIYDQSKIDTMLVNKKVRLDLENKDKQFFEKRLGINIKTYKKLQSYLKKNKFDRIIFPNGALYEWAIARLVCENLNIEFITLESHFAAEDDVIITRKNANCLRHDDEQVKELWEQNYPYNYDQNKEKIFLKFYNKINSKFDGHSMQLRSKDIQVKELKKKFNILEEDIVGLLTPSFSYEKHSRLKKYCFSDQTEWIIKTIDYIKDKNAKFIFKCHPIPYDPENDSFGFKNRSENPDEIIKNNFKTLPKNLILIKPEEKISINSLIDIADFGISYFSRSSIELAWKSKKSMVCTNIHFANKKFVETPKNEEDYYKFIDNCCNSKNNCKISQDLVNKSKYYVDVWWRQMPDKMPWSILRGFYNLNKYPFKKVLSLNFMISDYSRTFDKLIGANSYSKEKIIENYINKIKNKIDYKILLKYERLENFKTLLSYCLKYNKKIEKKILFVHFWNFFKNKLLNI